MRKILLIAVCVAAIPLLSVSQNENGPDTLRNKSPELDEVIVYANRFPELAKRVAQTVRVIKDKNTLSLQANTADILINTGSLFVQKSQQGGGSPAIRGFEASRVLLMIDGVRMNNAVFRAGHLQNIITTDNMILDRMEVLYGPSSTLYGSDALGGVINMYTKNPALSKSGKSEVTGNVLFRYANAIEEGRGHLDVNIGGKQWASFSSVTYGNFGSITQGSKRQSAYPDFGRKGFIVERAGNTDVVVTNPNPEKQSPGGYNQLDVAQKILYQPKENVQHIFNLQFSNSGDIPRYDKLTETSGGNPSFAEWYYGPQIRNMVAYHLSANKLNGFFQELKLTASFQDIGESRISRRFKNNNKDYRWERVNVFGMNADARHSSEKNELHLGIESYTNYVRSTAERRNIVTGAVSRISTRYSDGPTKMSFNAIYAQHTLNMNDSWTLNSGLRLNVVRLDARFADTTLMHFPFTGATQNNVAVTGNLGLIYASPENLRLALLINSGFRSPNVDDLSKVFDTRAGAVIVPNPGLQPEYTYNVEINFNQYREKFSYGGSVFYTWFRNAIVADKFIFNGQSNIMYDGVNSEIFANQNKAGAYVYGFSANASCTCIKNTSVEGVFTYTYGKYNSAGTSVPLDHIPPAYGRVAVKYIKKIWNAEFYTLFNGWKKIADHNPNGEDNQQYATIDGMPGWFTFNIRSLLIVNKHIQAQIAIENLADRNYRYFASGISAPGRNLVLSLRISF